MLTGGHSLRSIAATKSNRVSSGCLLVNGQSCCLIRLHRGRPRLGRGHGARSQLDPQVGRRHGLRHHYSLALPGAASWRLQQGLLLLLGHHLHHLGPGESTSDTPFPCRSAGMSSLSLSYLRDYICIHAGSMRICLVLLALMSSDRRARCAGKAYIMPMRSEQLNPDTLRASGLCRCRSECLRSDSYFDNARCGAAAGCHSDCNGAASVGVSPGAVDCLPFSHHLPKGRPRRHGRLRQGMPTFPATLNLLEHKQMPYCHSCIRLSLILGPLLAAKHSTADFADVTLLTVKYWWE